MMLLALGLALPQGPLTRVPPTLVRAPNVVVVVLDDVGVDQLGMYGLPPAWGEQPARTPVLDYLRATGVLFSRAWAAPLCSPSRAMMLTGRHGFRTGMLSLSEASGPCPPGTVPSGMQSCCPVGDPTCSQPGSSPVPPTYATGYSLPDSEVTLAEALRDATFSNPTSYARGAFGKWHLAAAPGDPCHAISQGFEIFQGHLFNNDLGALDHYAWQRVDARATTAGGCTSSVAPVQGEWDAERNEIDARAWIDSVLAEAAPRPFFAYVCFNPPHRAFQVPPHDLISPQTLALLAQAGLSQVGTEVEGVRSCQMGVTQEVDSRAVRLVYRASLEAIDTLIGRLVMKTSSPPALLDNTIVVVVSDNGTPDHVCQATQNPSEIGVNEPPFPPNRAKFHVYELGVRVPMIVAGTGVAQGATCDALVSVVDLWSTVLEHVHADVTGLVPASELDSRSFAARLAHPVGPPWAPDRTDVYAETAERNGFVYDRSAGTWSPFAPPPAVKYQRAVLGDLGFKYIRRVLGTDPGCATANPCSALREEEVYRLFDGPPVVDPFETNPLCGDAEAENKMALLRQVIVSSYSGF